MHTMKFVLAGVALALAGMLAVGVADASAKTKKSDEVTSNQARPSDLGGSDRQLQGRFYKKTQKAHKATASTK